MPKSKKTTKGNSITPKAVTKMVDSIVESVITFPKSDDSATVVNVGNFDELKKGEDFPFLPRDVTWKGKEVTIPVEYKEKIVEVIRTVEVERPRLEGYELYAKLRDIGYFQGGAMGITMENPNSVDKVYVPHAQEVLAFFSGDPEKWEQMRDGIIRTYIEINENQS